MTILILLMVVTAISGTFCVWRCRNLSIEMPAVIAAGEHFPMAVDIHQAKLGLYTIGATVSLIVWVINATIAVTLSVTPDMCPPVIVG